nr:MAG TPA: hypothetical protein [Caudoviricetes sp.]
MAVLHLFFGFPSFFSFRQWVNHPRMFFLAPQ